MSLRHTWNEYLNQGEIVTSTASLVVGPIDVSNFDKFSLMYQNNNTAIGFLTLHVQGAFDASANVGATAAPNWVTINSTTLPQPSALAASASVLTTAVDNTLKWIRVMGGASQTAVAGSFRLIVGGFQRS